MALNTCRTTYHLEENGLGEASMGTEKQSKFSSSSYLIITWKHPRYSLNSSLSYSYKLGFSLLLFSLFFFLFLATKEFNTSLLKAAKWHSLFDSPGGEGWSPEEYLRVQGNEGPKGSGKRNGTIDQAGDIIRFPLLFSQKPNLGGDNGSGSLT